MQKRRLAVGVGLCVSLIVGAASLLVSGSVYAQRDAETLNVGISAASDSYKALVDIPVMVSVIKEGRLIKQTESHLNSNVGFALPAGTYDIRLEGEGMQTLVKRGILVNEGERTQVVGGPMRVGTGVRVIEYATGGLSREEIAARLQKLEAALSELQKARQK